LFLPVIFKGLVQHGNWLAFLDIFTDLSFNKKLAGSIEDPACLDPVYFKISLNLLFVDFCSQSQKINNAQKRTTFFRI